MDRRDFLLGTLTAGPLLAFPKWSKAGSFFMPEEFLANDISPLERISAFSGTANINGDTPDEAHEIFWNKDGYIERKGGIPAVTSTYDVVIVGGGISGLMAAYELKGKKILLIDGNPRMGGNAKVQTIGRSFLSQGSAYITIPENGGVIDKFLAELKLKNSFRKTDEEIVNFQGKYIRGFWEGATDPARAAEFIKVKNKLSDIYENSFPELPLLPGIQVNRSQLNALDSLSIEGWMKKSFGKLHPHIEEYFHQYLWSSFCCAYSEISAAQALNFITADMAGTMALPGGNGMIAKALFDQLKARPEVTMIAPAFAVDILPEGGKVRVCYKNPEGSLVSVRAKSCVAATQKMVLKDVITGLPADQHKAMENISYRAYLVANVLLKRKIPSAGYDVFLLKGQIPTSEYQDSKERVFPDMVFADWAGKDQAEKTSLTLYIPIPYDMGQQYLFSADLYPKYQERIKNRLKDIGIAWTDVAGMRLTRFGHALPVASKGLIANGTFERAHRDLDTIVFAHNDNWGNPCFETSFCSGKLAGMKIKGQVR